ncbi:MAG TPA: glycoside hydrolase family 28 protein [Anaerolineales bacterium]|nr:glycoside hydrolase family 28 protein [Anaerolineales bacterium]
MTIDAGQASIYNVRMHGALGDGQTLDSPAIQKVIDSCAEQGGGTVYLPAGQYLAGSLFLRNNITLFLDSGAVICGSENPQDYPVIHSRWEGMHQDTYAPLIAGEHLQNIAVLGRGTIDGRGAVWWKAKKEKTLAHPRPRLISFSECTNVLIEGITAINSPSWTINPVHCQNVNIRGITIINPADSPNTDGINPDSCRFVRISDCYVSVGDDCITIKSGTEHERPDLHAPCRDITITNCTLERGHGGVVIGSEMSGGVKNVVISNCVFIGTDRGIRIKSRRGRGGTIEDIRVSNLIMDGVLCPFTMNLYYHIGVRGNHAVSDKNPRSVNDGTPRLRRIHFSDITAREVKHAAGFLYGLAEMPLEDISFSDISISLSDVADSGYPDMADDIPSMSQAGFFIRNARRIRLDHVQVTGQRGPAFDIDDSTEVEIIPPAK